MTISDDTDTESRENDADQLETTKAPGVLRSSFRRLPRFARFLGTFAEFLDARSIKHKANQNWNRVVDQPLSDRENWISRAASWFDRKAKRWDGRSVPSDPDKPSPEHTKEALAAAEKDLSTIVQTRDWSQHWPSLLYEAENARINILSRFSESITIDQVAIALDEEMIRMVAENRRVIESTERRATIIVGGLGLAVSVIVALGVNVIPKLVAAGNEYPASFFRQAPLLVTWLAALLGGLATMFALSVLTQKNEYSSPLEMVFHPNYTSDIAKYRGHLASNRLVAYFESFRTRRIVEFRQRVAMIFFGLFILSVLGAGIFSSVAAVEAAMSPSAGPAPPTAAPRRLEEDDKSTAAKSQSPPLRKPIIQTMPTVGPIGRPATEKSKIHVTGRNEEVAPLKIESAEPKPQN